MIKAIVAGAAGRMGGRIIHMISQTEGIELAASFDKPGNNAIGQDAGIIAGCGELGVKISDSLESVIDQGDVIIDFTFHTATLEHARHAASKGKAMVIGTTGFTNEELDEIKKLSETFPCVLAPNMSVGVNLLYKLIDMAAKVLEEDYDIEIIEAHHRLKKDAPSGTALQLARVAANARGKKLEDLAIYERYGIIGERPRGQIGIQTVRAGDIVGEHTVLFGGTGERIEIVHKASSRDTFASGAVRAAKWIVDKSAGMYSMLDVLGI